MEQVEKPEMIKLVFINDNYADKGTVVYANRRAWRNKDFDVIRYWENIDDIDKLEGFYISRHVLKQEIPDPVFQLVFTQYFNGVCVGEIDFPSMEWDEVALAAHSFARSMNIPETRRNFWELDTPDIGYKIRIDKVEV